MDLMELLYRIMEELSKAGVPIVFKGAMVLNLAIKDNNPSNVERGTRDIDGDWIDDGPSMKQMEEILRDAVKRVDDTLDVCVVREFGEKKSAGFKILNDKGEKIASVDLSVRKNEFIQPYTSYLNDVVIKGASLDKMISDKLYATSDNAVCRRVKDLLDIYIMSYVADFSISEICEIWKKTDRQPGDFTEFRTHMAEIEYAYDKMKGIKSKPAFVELFSRLSDFLQPFFDLEHHQHDVWTRGRWEKTVKMIEPQVRRR